MDEQETALRVLVEKEMSRAAAHELAGGVAMVFSTGKPGVERPNEDSAMIYAIGPERAVIAVADGAGGLPSGAQASELAIGVLKSSLERAGSGGIRDAIISGFDEANRAVLDLGVGAATTLAVVEIHADTLRPFHAGDSKILVVGQRGKLKLISLSHSPVGYAIEAGVIDRDEALHHEERHLVSNCLGLTDMRIELGTTLQLAKYDTVIVGSDGLFDNLRIEEIVDRVRAGSIEAGAENLRRVCQKRMENPAADQPSKPDDLTFVIYRRSR